MLNDHSHTVRAGPITSQISVPKFFTHIYLFSSFFNTIYLFCSFSAQPRPFFLYLFTIELPHHHNTIKRPHNHNLGGAIACEYSYNEIKTTPIRIVPLLSTLLDSEIPIFKLRYRKSLFLKSHKKRELFKNKQKRKSKTFFSLLRLAYFFRLHA